MTFTMLRSVEPLFAGPAERQLTTERLTELERGAHHLGQVVPQLASLEEKIRRIAPMMSTRES
jgi:hypothetical protein